MGQQHQGQEETSKRNDKKIVATTRKMRDPNGHCKHCDVDGHKDEKCWKLHYGITSKIVEFQGEDKRCY